MAGIAGFGALTASGRPLAGLALGIGLLIGGANALLAARAVEFGVAFGLTSLARIGLLSMVALSIGFLIQPSTAWLTVIGVAGSQFIMTAVAARSVWRK